MRPFRLLGLALAALTIMLVLVPSASAGSLGAGRQASCAVKTSGTVSCWGAAGRLGNAAGTASATPVTVEGVTNAVEVAGGQDHFCALRSDRRVSCWGRNNVGQLGVPNGFDGVDPALAPVTVEGLDDAVGLTTGVSHTCVIRAGGTVRCFGDAGNGRLGNGTGNGITDVVSIAAGSLHTCAARLSGSVACWGAGAAAQPPAIGDAVEVAAGNSHSCALRAGGEVICWGANGAGQLGVGTTTTPSPYTNVPGIHDAVAVAAGAFLTCAVRSGGSVSCWGSGHLGHVVDDASISPSPVTVAGLSDATDVVLATVGTHACALRSSGAVSCWGANVDDQLGNGVASSTGTPVTALTGAGAVRQSDATVCAVMLDATARCWGGNFAGEIGDGTTKTRPAPATVAGLTGATQIAPGDEHTCALRSGGTVMCWGANEQLQLGAPGPDSPVPSTVPGVAGATQIGSGRHQACALIAVPAQVTCWGERWYAPGPGLYSNEYVEHPPTPITGTDNATDLAVMDGTNCALILGGTVRCWGTGSHGALGSPGGPNGDHTEPVAVTGIATAVDIEAISLRAACARLADDTIKCWGQGYGNAPVTVPGTAFPTTGPCTLVGTTVRCVGSGVGALLGDGFQPAGHYPVQPVPGAVPGISSVRQPPPPPVQPVDVTVAPTALAFPTTAVGPTSDPLAVTLTNTSARTVPLFLETPPPAPASEFGLGPSTCGGTLAPGASCTVSYTFHPTSAGTKAGSATIKVANAERTIALTGAGLSGFLVNPAQLGFPATMVGAASAPQTMTIVNVSGITRALNLGVTGLGTDFRHTTTCGAKLDVGTACTVTFTFHPTAAGVRAARPVLSLAGTENPLALTGTGVAGVTPFVVSNAFTFRSAKASKTRIKVALTLPGPGIVRVAATTKVKRKGRTRTATYATLRRVTVRKGARTLTLKPTKSGAALLRRLKKAKIAVKVTYTPTGGRAAAKTRRVTVKAAARSRRSARRGRARS